MKLTAFFARAAAILVAAVAGYASYRHIYDVAIAAGEPMTVAGVLPLAIDGLILVATLAMVQDKQNHRQPRLSARVALGFGILATLAGNTASAEPTAKGYLVAAVPAVSFLLAVEVLARTGKRIDVPVRQPVTEPVTEDTVWPWDYAEPIGPEPAHDRQDVGKAPAKPRAKRSTPPTLTNAEKVARVAAKMPDATNAEIAKKAGVSERTVTRHRPRPTNLDLPPAAAVAEGFDTDPGRVTEMYARMGYDASGVLVATPPSGQDAAETTTDEAVNGQPVDLTEVTR